MSGWGNKTDAISIMSYVPLTQDKSKLSGMFFLLPILYRTSKCCNYPHPCPAREVIFLLRIMKFHLPQCKTVFPLHIYIHTFLGIQLLLWMFCNHLELKACVHIHLESNQSNLWESIIEWKCLLSKFSQLGTFSSLAWSSKSFSAKAERVQDRNCATDR